MRPLYIHENAAQELKALVTQFKAATGAERKMLKAAIGRISATLESMKTDPDFQARMLKHEDPGSAEDLINFQKWVEQQKLGNDLRRAKLWDGPELVKYRIIYAYRQDNVNESIGTFYVLGIVNRDKFNYESKEKNPLSARIIEDYERLSAN